METVMRWRRRAIVAGLGKGEVKGRKAKGNIRHSG